MILSLLATVAVLAAIAVIAAALVLAETTLVYVALGLGGLSVLLLLGAIIQGRFGGARADTERTDGLGKASVPVEAATAVGTAPARAWEPEESRRAPAPADQPVRESAVSEQPVSDRNRTVADETEEEAEFEIPRWQTPTVGSWPEPALRDEAPVGADTPADAWPETVENGPEPGATPAEDTSVEETPAPGETSADEDREEGPGEEPAAHGAEETGDASEPDDPGRAFAYRIPAAVTGETGRDHGLTPGEDGPPATVDTARDIEALAERQTAALQDTAPEEAAPEAETTHEYSEPVADAEPVQSVERTEPEPDGSVDEPRETPARDPGDEERPTGDGETAETDPAASADTTADDLVRTSEDVDQGPQDAEEGADEAPEEPERTPEGNRTADGSPADDGAAAGDGDSVLAYAAILDNEGDTASDTDVPDAEASDTEDPDPATRETGEETAPERSRPGRTADGTGEGADDTTGEEPAGEVGEDPRKQPDSSCSG
ncbi:hypothetical protein GCM10007079_33490 [Nocardiopsis terrae]|uniref:Uncharacterized protein n=1 Tax=Nocardiopsis terrae TaxID=372655 RepID=A0ABR9HJH6_9ACTN|nr:hypothetical protein [Nocardiopsis terrae]MBE1459162.1 hypothetical protein [Nocardiopsis terrae]GHC88485.1 hypothetical protein GCM10007079_33490 [Nocardiopsis terrae]